ncbi:MAG: TIGR04255 family protein [Chloroflexota bacterium]|nr:TIGR04255 family protein [Chloroflexota bacterium]
MGRRYQKPPVIEALCEFQFEPSTPWDLTIPGLVYERIKGQFPKKRPAKALEVSVAAGPDGVRQSVLTTDRMQFLQADGNALVQVAQDLLVVNQLKPYPTWREFLPLIRQGFDAYEQVVDPKGVRRVSLRYINRVEIPVSPLELADYFEFLPLVGPRLPQDFGNFMVGVEFGYEGSRDTLRLQMVSALGKAPDAHAVMLDLDYFLAQPGRTTLASVFEWVGRAHDRIEEVFEACIKDRLRTMFMEVT